MRSFGVAIAAFLMFFVAAPTTIAQVSGDIAVEVEVHSRKTGRPLENAVVLLYQTAGATTLGGGFYTDANGFIALEAPPLVGATINQLQILCRDVRHRKDYTQTVELIRFEGHA